MRPARHLGHDWYFDSTYSSFCDKWKCHKCNGFIYILKGKMPLHNDLAFYDMPRGSDLISCEEAVIYRVTES